MFDMNFLPKKPVDRNTYRSRRAATGNRQTANAATEQIARRQQAFKLPRHRFAGIEQRRSRRHAPGNRFGDPRVMRAAQDDDIRARCNQWCHEKIKQSFDLDTPRPLRFNRFGQPRTGLSDHFQMRRMIADQSLKTLALQSTRRRQNTDHAGFGEPHGRLDARLKCDNRQGRRRTNCLGSSSRCCVAGDHQSLGSALRQGFGNQNPAFLEENFRAITIGQKAGIREIKKVFLRQPTAQGAQDGQAAEAGIKDGDGLQAQ